MAGRQPASSLRGGAEWIIRPGDAARRGRRLQGLRGAAMSATLRLDRLLANMGYGSRREVQALVRAGRVLLDGEAVADADLRLAVTPEL
ncbi:MAG TPA: S4 domain-containing protein, partial [Caulobacteraceae bacterium]|nr:S4 domain-containing protein [Caulobacteraceae bacterium]